MLSRLGALCVAAISSTRRLPAHSPGLAERRCLYILAAVLPPPLLVPRIQSLPEPTRQRPYRASRSSRIMAVLSDGVWRPTRGISLRKSARDSDRGINASSINAINSPWTERWFFAASCRSRRTSSSGTFFSVSVLLTPPASKMVPIWNHFSCGTWIPPEPSREIHPGGRPWSLLRAAAAPR